MRYVNINQPKFVMNNQKPINVSVITTLFTLLLSHYFLSFPKSLLYALQANKIINIILNTQNAIKQE